MVILLVGFIFGNECNIFCIVDSFFIFGVYVIYGLGSVIGMYVLGYGY